MTGPPSPTDPEFFLKLVAPLVRAAFTSPLETRNHYLYQCLATAKAMGRFCFELAPMFFPASTTADVTAFLNANFVKSQERLTELAGLDPYQAESFVLTMQRAIEEIGRDVEMSQMPHEDPAIETGREATKLMGQMLDMMKSLQSTVFEHDAKLRDLQARLDKLMGRQDAE